MRINNYQFRGLLKLYRQLRLGEKLYTVDMVYLYSDLYNKNKIYEWKYVHTLYDCRLDKEFINMGYKVYIKRNR